MYNNVYNSGSIGSKIHTNDFYSRVKIKSEFCKYVKDEVRFQKGFYNPNSSYISSIPHVRTYGHVTSSGMSSTHSVAKGKTWWVENWRRRRRREEVSVRAHRGTVTGAMNTPTTINTQN